jgi:hypothetical protein
MDAAVSAPEDRVLHVDFVSNLGIR